MTDPKHHRRPWLELHEYTDRDRRWTQQALADATGFTKGYVGELLRGQRRVTPNVIRAFADALEVPYSVLKPHPTPRQQRTPWRELETYIAVDKHWTNTALAERAGMSEHRLHQLRSGALTPTTGDIHTLADTLKLPVRVLTPAVDDDHGEVDAA